MEFYLVAPAPAAPWASMTPWHGPSLKRSVISVRRFASKV